MTGDGQKQSYSDARLAERRELEDARRGARANWMPFWIRMRALRVDSRDITQWSQEMHLVALQHWPQRWLDELQARIERWAAQRDDRRRAWQERHRRPVRLERQELAPGEEPDDLPLREGR